MTEPRETGLASPWSFTGVFWPSVFRGARGESRFPTAVARGWLIGWLVGLMVRVAAGVGDPAIRHAMYEDPKIELPAAIETVSPKLIPLWLQALESPEVDLRRQAANGIAIVHAAGLADLSETAGPLIEVLRRPDQHPVVVEAAVHALVVIDARQAADLLFQRARSGEMTVAQRVEPALARWDYRPIRDVWLGRLRSPDTRRRLMMLAIQGLAEVGEVRAVPDLVRLAQSPEAAADLRLAAARAVAALCPEGRESDARRLLASSATTRVDRLVAAWMISQHRSPESRQLFLELAVDPEPSVAAVALRSLLAVDPERIVSIIDQVTKRPDANLRLLGVQALAARSSARRVELLAAMLDDPHPEVRRLARRSLVEMGEVEELTEAAIARAMEMLARDDWRGQEQAMILLVHLDHKPAAGRLIELLESARPEVAIGAAWALGKLAVPETLPAMCEKARQETEAALRRPGVDGATGEQLGHLFQALGRLQYEPIEPVLRHYVPKRSPFPPQLRSAAIWGLGHLYAGRPDPEMVRLLVERVADEDTFMEPGEAFEVRAMSAVSLGRMKAPKALGTLRRFVPPSGIGDEFEYACGWAISQITGDPMPPPEPPRGQRGGWFLNPLD